MLDGQLDSVETTLTKAQNILAQFSDASAAAKSRYYMLKGEMTYIRGGISSTVIDYLKKAWEEIESFKEEDPPLAINIQKWLAINYQNFRNMERAKYHYDLALAEVQHFYDDQHWEMASVYLSMGHYYNELNDSLTSLTYLQEASNIWKACNYHRGQVYAYMNLGVYHTDHNNEERNDAHFPFTGILLGFILTNRSALFLNTSLQSADNRLSFHRDYTP